MAESSKLHALFFICLLFISSATPILGCGTCGKPPPKHKPKPKTPKGPSPPIHVKPPVIKVPPVIPPIVKPPVTIPPIVKPPVTIPPIIPPIVKPPVTIPPIVKPPVTIPPILPPVTLPPIVPPGIIPPVIGGGPPGKKPPSPGTPCPPPAESPGAKDTCPIDTLKLGACVDLLGGLVHIGQGDPVVNECCPVLQGLVELEAAVCLCTTLKIKLLNLNVFFPIALQLLVTCGKSPPPGYTCSL